ncbi:protein of unknown function [Clostridium beijerinckii]|nr:protein of unknown function [Clostridium beijerinckii]
MDLCIIFNNKKKTALLDGNIYISISYNKVEKDGISSNLMTNFNTRRI